MKWLQLSRNEHPVFVDAAQIFAVSGNGGSGSSVYLNRDASKPTSFSVDEAPEAIMKGLESAVDVMWFRPPPEPAVDGGKET